MSAHSGDSTPNAFVFPPFAPPVFRAPAPPPAAPASAPPEEQPEEPAAYDFAMEVPLPAHDLGDPDDLPQQGFDADEAGSQPWETSAPPAGEDLPWLEMPAEGPRVHTSETAADDETPGWTPDAPADSFAQESDEVMPWAAPEPPIADSSWESILAPADEPAPAAESRAQAEPVAQPAPHGLMEVVERLESIARSLREDPDGFLAGNAGDPLGLLVTGFVLGYSRRDY
ncbi:MAG TPA: hypothetical protein VF613_11560 [Longimicrobium sp.]|jgi:hypothetical protein